MLSDIQFEFLKDVSKLINYCIAHNIKITAGELYRTEYQQAEYLKTGKSKTNNSYHLKRLAIDLNFFIDGQLTTDIKKIQNIGMFFEGLNPKNKAGMFFKTFYDPGHFERQI